MRAGRPALSRGEDDGLTASPIAIFRPARRPRQGEGPARRFGKVRQGLALSQPVPQRSPGNAISLELARRLACGVRRQMAQRWTPKAGGASRSSRCRTTPTTRRCRTVEETLRNYPPLVFAGEARRLKDAARRGRRGQGLPAAGRRLRRELRRIPPQQHPRHLPRAAADGGGADLRRRLPGGQGRPHGRPVRQAALVRHRDAERRHPAVLSRRHHQRHGFDAGGARARPAAHGPGLQPVGGDAQSAARLRPGRLCRSAPRP